MYDGLNLHRAQMRIAVLSDIHGNAWALDAVLSQLTRAHVDHVLNLGDCFYGPLDPRGTWERLATRDWPTVRGNQDRSLMEGTDHPTGRYTLQGIGKEGVAWVADHTRATLQFDGILACHGNLRQDDVTLIERIEPTHVRLATHAELSDALAAADTGTEVVVCGHSHRPGALHVPGGRLVVNPGSVGLPAYEHDVPYPHAMESGTPHARWAILERRDDGWHLEQHATPYDTAAAIGAARRNGRGDWAAWLATGRAAAR